MLDYTTDLLDKCLQQSREWREKEQNGEAGLLERLIREQDGEENPNYILKYWCYFKAFHEHGQESLYLDNDITKFKGYFYLAAKAGKNCFALYEKGYRSATHLSFMSPSVLENKNTNFNFAAHALLAGCRDLAKELAAKDSPLEAVLNGDFERAKGYLPSDIKEISSANDPEKILWTILYHDEKKMNKQIEKRIKEIRRYNKRNGFADHYMDYWMLSLLKIAKEYGMNCSLNIIELPLQALDDSTPINEDEWRLPADKELEKILG